MLLFGITEQRYRYSIFMTHYVCWWMLTFQYNRYSGWL